MFKFATDMNKTIRVLIIAILTSTVITENKYTWCKMNNTLIVPYNSVTLKNDSIIWTNGESSKKYSKSTYRKVDVGFELCICAVESCVYKCCKENDFYVHNECKVLDDSINFTFRVPKSINGSGFMEEYNESHFHIVYGKPKCLKSKYRLNPYNKSTDIFHISQTGLLIKSTNNKPVETDQYCVESFLSSNFRVLPLVYFQPKDDLVDDSIQINLVFTIGMLLSLPFLFATFLIYALISELRNVYGKSLMCHVAALFIAYSGLILIQINFFQLHQIVCHVLAYIVQFAFLASFFWLNVMCFDLWQTFRKRKKNQYEKFTKHSIYAWGCPSAISIISLYIELSPHIPKSIIRPEFGRENCWFYSKLAQLIYLYGPISIILLSNLVMFIKTSKNIESQIKRSVCLEVRSNSKRRINYHNQRYLLHLKLYIVMGVNWLAEVLSSYCNFINSIWLLTDFGNAMQGLLIFGICVCNKRVLNLLKKKLNIK